MLQSIWRGCRGLVLLLVGALPLCAQPVTGGPGASHAGRSPSTPRIWGQPGDSILSIGAASFVPRDSVGTFGFDSSVAAKYCTGGTCWLETSLSLPTGASLAIVDFEAFDDDPAGGGFDVSGELFVCSGNPPGTPCQSLGSNNTAGNPGWTSFALSFPPLPVTIDNLNNQYVLAIFLPDDGGLTAFRRAIVYYHLQVSPAPMVATFNDVPVSDGAFQFIEAFSQAGITVGCGGGNYCPDDFVTRRQMAVFFAKAFGLFWAN